jgi:hypothetical protein
MLYVDKNLVESAAARTTAGANNEINSPANIPRNNKRFILLFSC